MKIAIIGVTGLVGETILKVLKERKFPVDEIIPVASKNSLGKNIIFNKKKYKIISIDESLKLKPNIVMFSSGNEISKNWSEKFVDSGSYVIDNSSFWRMNKNIKLIIPEINSSEISLNDRIISNPNCSTIQLLMVLYPLHIKYKIDRVVVSTYQSVTGTGKKAIKQLNKEIKKIKCKKIYPHKIHNNIIPHCDSFEKNGYTKEEIKLINESRKIMKYNDLKITSTAVRVPVTGGHSESVNITFKKDFKIYSIKNILKSTTGIKVQDDTKNNIYPMPIYSKGKNDVFVGRIRKDFSKKKSINIWIVSDNLRKGAATNAVQIAEFLLKKKYI